jgi:putative transposase
MEKKISPSYGIVDAQSSKTLYASKSVGIDGGKKVKGRKRHICVDTNGLLLNIKVHAANIHDTIGGMDVFAETIAKYPTIKGFSADAGYGGTSKRFVEEALKRVLEISRKIKDAFVIMPKRWVVERTFAWIGNFRRLSKDYEILTKLAENVFRIAMIRITLKKLF